ncbi:hypothetical protein ACWDG1_32700 [Streptomyces sp. NPDC001177]
MSVTRAPWGVSNPNLKLWVITVVVIVIDWRAVADALTSLADVLTLVAVLGWGGVQQGGAATAPTLGRLGRSPVAA